MQRTEAVATHGTGNAKFKMKVESLCFEMCYSQRNALTVKKSKAKTGRFGRFLSMD